MPNVLRFAAAVVAFMVLAWGGFGQATPDLSGTWSLIQNPDPPAGATQTRQPAQSAGRVSDGTARNAPARICGIECTIRQSARTLTIARPADAQGVVPPEVVVNLDGSESPNTQAGRDGGPPTTYELTARWEGRSLVLVRRYGSEGQLTATQTLSREGDTLIIVSAANVAVTSQTSRYRLIQ